MQFQVSSEETVKLQPQYLGILPHPFSLMTEIPWFSYLPALTLEWSNCELLVLKKTGLTCASSLAFPAPGVGLPKP